MVIDEGGGAVKVIYAKDIIQAATQHNPDRMYSQTTHTWRYGPPLLTTSSRRPDHPNLPNNFKIIAWNIEGLARKDKTFYNEILQNQPLVFFLSETWHTYTFNYKPIIEQYNIYESFGTRTSNYGRCSNGHILAIHNSIISKIKIMKQTVEAIHIQYVDHIKIGLIFTYLSPSCSTPLKSIFENLNPFNDMHP